jgi:fibronectin type 3 domain-containing protein
LSWTDQPDAAGYNVYRTTASHLGYVRINGTPVEGTSFFDDGVTAGGSYYYVVTAVGATGLESNRSDEIRPADVAPVSTAAGRSPGPAVSTEAR